MTSAATMAEHGHGAASSITASWRSSQARTNCEPSTKT
jgi:hypothetical protein